MTSKGDKGTALIVFAVGTLLGAGIALLLAPQSGKKTRRDIRRMGKRALNKAEELRSELSHSVDNLADAVWERLQEDVERGRDWTEQTLSEVKRALDSGKDFIRGELSKVGRS